ncbi:rod shape-determining protein MreC [Candidatus Falkowbacteria bacterium]|uniref:Cell shape-determining protein MreC n=1 Tax=Candidatus Buchananbacteria bacterium CG10_big_fil_rev_8_21_14_0_10_33_19 TaxID=1974525 RepID=A0A2H0W5L6_9BACT|nr:rod shape-determining protein MreC [Candidatus Falkowbacteria bacterium]PIS05891.1 MAG: rod shape-determining protein MreC [Candidatus Buchananbacteria bacterium CG10_big_fil_rev_8_21_14_0_10_33_19]
MNNFFKLIIFGLLTIFLLVIFHYINLFNPIEGYIIKLLSPIQEKTYSMVLGAKEFKTNWINKRDLIEENKALEQKLKELKVDRSKVNSLESENKLLKDELRFIKESQLNTVTAKIITGVSDSLSKSVVINHGSDSGIEKGMAVISGDGIMIGKIYEVYSDHSKVLLLTDNKSRVAATIQNLDKTTGLVEGQFGLSFSMTNIPQDQEIKEGDLIVSSGLEGKIPKDLLIAQVDSINQVESEIFKTALLSPIVSLDNLSYVLVIVP